MNNSTPSNTLGNASLALGIASAVLVFGIGMCALAAPQALQLEKQRHSSFHRPSPAPLGETKDAITAAQTRISSPTQQHSKR